MWKNLIADAKASGPKDRQYQCAGNVLFFVCKCISCTLTGCKNKSGF